jgi:uncharacterized LabA/DUF88 family protein
MRIEPEQKRVIAFFDGQNMFHGIRDTLSIRTPNYDPEALARLLCETQPGWTLVETRFYTGVPGISHNPAWHGFWANKLSALNRRPNVTIYSRTLHYQPVALSNGETRLVPKEKGIDVRIAIDMISLTLRKQLDVILLFSQDQDFSEVAREIREISIDQQRWIKIASAYPTRDLRHPRRSVNATDWLPFDQGMYLRCIDTMDYFPPREPE